MSGSGGRPSFSNAAMFIVAWQKGVPFVALWLLDRQNRKWVALSALFHLTMDGRWAYSWTFNQDGLGVIREPEFRSQDRRAWADGKNITFVEGSPTTTRGNRGTMSGLAHGTSKLERGRFGSPLKMILDISGTKGMGL
ncbi:uncharacterized protein BDR25DRAFT_354822 [Lindgomyces ingoldianus]|uniref:Uncharacterized protein n=1 Tax=Lindgomyces ingoldianus TaxID=673940 RepID=A0ACB6QWI9_9PLEO|nr:uncharacterized protein BDR25DRAFT_354822 [Lindgomyces ingoldianus]KAF2470875.1 hypothetical protein BDR25DRAFT_354822 [Lindgomyces ingoldianus]